MITGFLVEPERLNVAVTRAKDISILVGNVGTLKKNKMFQQMLKKVAVHDYLKSEWDVSMLKTIIDNVQSKWDENMLIKQINIKKL